MINRVKGGESSHNFGTAIDVVPIIDGNADWNTDWNIIAKIGKELGFSRGGDWESFKDKPHFEMNFGHSLADLRSRYNQGLIRDGYVIQTA
ncbi:MAG: M15 family metallopeptidase [Saprospiraceae bacterium]|nr:M15 family metallopeptidase [Candidatus Defluviibacterium haderslevense]MBK7244469.1 M15 family metallopeptidase [Candidatus Defluviibacterium haderslevense]